MAELNGAAPAAGVPRTSEGVEVPNWRQWLSRHRASIRLGVNTRRFDKMVKEGELPKPLECPDATLRWDPVTIDEKVIELEQDGGDSETQVDNVKAQADLSKAGAQLIAVATGHTERMLQLLERPLKQANEALMLINRSLQDELEATRERVSRVEEERTKLITAREEMLSEQAARDIAARESANRDARRKQIFEIFAQRVPGVFDALGKSLGLNPQDQVKVKAVIDLANDLDPMVLEMLVQTGAVSEKQKALIETILGKKISAEPEAPQKATSDGTANE